MNDSIYRISLDIHDSIYQGMLKIKKSDTNRAIKIVLSENGFNYTITDDCSAVLRAKLPNGTTIDTNGTISRNEISIGLVSGITANAGIVECELILNGSSSSKLTSPRFFIQVEDCLNAPAP